MSLSLLTFVRMALDSVKKAPRGVTLSGSTGGEGNKDNLRVKYDTIGGIPVLLNSILEDNFSVFKDFSGEFKEYHDLVAGRISTYFNVETWLMACVDVGINGRELISGYIPVICGVAGLFQGSNLVSEPIAGILEGLGLWNQVSRPRLKASILGYHLQFEIGSRVLNLWRPDLLILDGPLVVPSHLKLLGLREDMERLVGSLIGLLTEARRMEIPVIGFVKRSRSMLLSKKLGLRLRDSALLSQVLEVGEFTKPVEISDIAHSRYRAYLKGDVEILDGLYCFYMKSVGGRVYRVEVSGWDHANIGGLASLLYHLAEPSTGVPVPLMIVDDYSKVTDKVADSMLLGFISRVLRAVKDGELANDVLKLLVLQYGERAVGGVK